MLKTLWNGRMLPKILINTMSGMITIVLETKATYCIHISPANALQSTTIALLLLLWITWLVTDMICSLSIFPEVILQLIQSLDPNKTHGQHKMSVKSLKLCVPSPFDPLTLFLRLVLSLDIFLSSGKKSNIALAHKNGNKQFNSFMTVVSIIQKPVPWFADQIKGLVSIR